MDAIDGRTALVATGTESLGAGASAMVRFPAVNRPGQVRTIAVVSDRERRFRALFDAHYGQLCAFARRRLSPADADDLVAEVFSVAWRRLDDIPTDAHLAWLYGVAHRSLANQRRSADRRRRLLERVAVLEPRPESSDSDHTAVLNALGRLPTADQDVLRLAAWEDLTTPEIAMVLSCTVNAAALRLSRARKHLRLAMTGAEPSRTQGDRRATDD